MVAAWRAIEQEAPTSKSIRFKWWEYVTAGTKLYSHGSSMEYKDTEYVEVTDGKQLGYVRAEALKTLY